MSTPSHILVVDDDREIRDLLAQFLETQGMRVTAARDGEELRRLWQQDHYHLVVLDLMLPGETGLELASFLRRQSTIPIIMLTAMSEPTDRIVGLELGADDYVAKPFNPRELLARIRAVLRRSADAASSLAPDPHDARYYIFCGWRLDIARRRLTREDGVEVALTTGEYELLLIFLERPNRTLAREELQELLRGPDALPPHDRSIDVAVSRLRRKLASPQQGIDVAIKTVRGGGYMLANEVEKI